MNRITQSYEKYMAVVKFSQRSSLAVENPAIGENGFTVTLRDVIDRKRSSIDLFVRADENVTATKDQIAVIVAAMVLKKYRQIYFDFDVGVNTIGEVKKLTGAEARALSVREDSARPVRENWSLGFSGGMDSTALALLCPGLIPVMTDFDLSEREKTASKKLVSPLRVRTNACEFLFPHSSAGYLNIGSLLLADTKRIKYTINGKIMTDDPHLFDYLDGLVQDVVPDAPDGVYGITVLYPLAGLTMIGAQKIVHAKKPKIFDAVLEASGFVQSDQELKSYRVKLRSLLRKIITSREQAAEVNKFIDWDAPEGGLFKFYVPYIINRLGADRASELVKNIPGEAVAASMEMRLDFYERYDPRALKNAPEDFAGRLLEHMEEAGIGLYDGTDYAERARVLELVSLV